MTKIAIISCIVAVCVFQTAEAGIFDTSGLDSVLGDVKSRVTDALGKVKNVEQEVENRGKGLISDIQNKLESSKSVLQTSAECTNAYSEAQQVINGLIVTFQACVSNETQAHSADMQTLSHAVDILTSVLIKSFKDVVDCFQLLGTPWEITKIVKCFSAIPQDLSELAPVIQDAVSAATELAKIFPNVRVCYGEAVIRSVAPNAAELVKDVQQCFKSVLQPFKL